VKTAEFYCGTKSFSKVAATMEMETFTIDIIKGFKPDLKKNMLFVTPEDLPYQPDVVWASPDCSAWSCAAGSHHFTRQMEAKTVWAEMAIKHIQFLIGLIEEINPIYWYIENPRGRLRRMDFMKPFIRHTVTYCQYGDTRQKPTDIWTNNPNWQPKPPCESQDGCHSSTTLDLTTARQRAAIPPALMHEILLASTPRPGEIIS